MLKNGKWVADWQPVQAKDEKGGFVRQTSSGTETLTHFAGHGLGIIQKPRYSGADDLSAGRLV